jgi:hypothetical protein
VSAAVLPTHDNARPRSREFACVFRLICSLVLTTLSPKSYEICKNFIKDIKNWTTPCPPLTVTNMRFALVMLVCSIACALRATPFLTISSATTNVIVNADEFAGLPHTKIKLMDPHEKKAHQFSGVAVSEILARAGAPSGEKLRGHALRLIVIFRARDGYAVSFSLADFDADYSDRTIFLADQEDGAPLWKTSGPLRLIVPGDKKAARWERMVSSIEIRDPDNLTH